MNSDRTQAILKVLERLPVPVVIANPVTARVLWVNANLVRMGRGSHPDDFVGKSILDFVRPEQMAKALTDLAAVAAGGSPKPVIYELQRLDGERSAVHVSSIPMLFKNQPAMLSLVTDVSEREQLIRDLAQSEERYRALVDNSPSGIVVVVDREIVFANDALARALGFDGGARLLGSDMYDFIAPEQRTGVREARRGVLQTGKPHPPVEVTFVRRDDTSFTTSVATTRVWWDGQVASQTLIHDLPAVADGA